jgi:hypothetical protein
LSNLVFPTFPGLDVKVRREALHNTIEQKTLTRQRLAYYYETYPLYRYTLIINLLRSATAIAEFQQLAGFLAQHLGRFDNFLFQDPEDNVVSDHGFGVGDGTTTAFQLQRALLGGVYDIYGGPWPRSSKPRTNLTTFSEQLDNAAWTKTSVTVTASAAVAPDGNFTAGKLIAAAATAVHKILGGGTTFGAGHTCTVSVFAKAAEYTTISLGSAHAPGFLNNAKFDLSAGTVLSDSTGGGAKIAACGNGWYRCSLTFASANLDGFLISPKDSASFLGDGTSGVYVWGAQTEFSSAVTQYIATTSAVVTSTPAYWSAAGDGFEPVFEVVPGETILVDGVAKVRGADYGMASGLVTFTVAPASGAVLSWTGSYYRRVCFETDNMPLDRIVQSMWEAKQVTLLSVKGTGVGLVSTPLLPRTETPSGTINGTTGSDGNPTFTLSRVPLATTPVNVYLRGKRLLLTTEYTISGVTLTLIAPNIPLTGDVLQVDYFAY